MGKHNDGWTTCDFCQGTVSWRKQYDGDGRVWWLVFFDGAGSDHLATWCASCGPKHRKGE